MARRATLTNTLAALLALTTALGGVGGPVPAAAQAPDAPSLAIPADGSLATDAATDVADTAAPIEGDVDLTVVAADAQARVAALPLEDWDLVPLAEALDYDPVAAFAWVRDRIAFDAYAGELRGSLGTLGARAGNSFDRAILLHDLLDTMRVPVRFAVGTLDDANVAAVLARAFVPATIATLDPERAGQAPLDLAAIAGRARRDHARLRAALGDRIATIGDADTGQAAADIRRHAWVQALVGTEWLDLDTTLPGAVAGDRLAVPAEIVDAIAPADQQTVTITLDAQTELDGVLTPMTALTTTLVAADAAEAELWLYFQPQLTGIGGSIVDALGGAPGFVPILLVDGETVRGQSLPTGPATDILSGETQGGPEVASIRLVVDRSVPGRAPVRSERVLLDRVVPGSDPTAPVTLTPLETDEAGPVALQPMHHLLVSTGGANPWRSAARRAMAVDLASRLVDDPETDAAVDDLVFPIAVADESLVLASERSIITALGDGRTVRAWVAEPRVYLVSLGANVESRTVPRATTDLLADPVAVVAADDAEPGSAAKAELWYGTLQAALETEYLLSLARGDGGTVRSVSVATRDPLTVLAGAEASGPTTPAGLRAALDAGLIAIVPGDQTTAVGWWTVDPATGTTRSVSRDGLGFGDYARGGRGYPPSKPNTGPRYDPTRSGSARPKVPAGSCNGANEYTTPIGCTSLPGAVAFWGTSVAVYGVVAYCINLLWQFAIGYD